ncbi:MAG: PIN domain-containing protein [Bacteroidales bacterium]|jgi:predicted nucleic acid-binding protein|nr:PIN domain-containing protein [Bacteroidales bacterium]
MLAEKIFLDSNVLIYAYFKQDERKQRISQGLVAQNSIISTQVLQELSNTLHKKMKIDYDIVRLIVQECVHNCKLHINTSDTIFSAFDIAQRYTFSFYDSLIIAAAQENNCTILYSEDMQHKQRIGNCVIQNPFL